MPAATRRGPSAASPSKPAAKAGGRKATESAAAPKEASAAAASAAPSTATPHSALAYAFYQYGGLLCCVTGVALLWLGYGAGWMHDTKLTLLCVALNVLGLFLHETRPFSVSECCGHRCRPRPPRTQRPPLLLTPPPFPSKTTFHTHIQLERELKAQQAAKAGAAKAR
jgi:hypothetical protein